MRIHRAVLLSGLFVFASLVFSVPIVKAQGVTPRITQAVDNEKRVTLRGNTYPLARSEYDRGAAPDSLPMERMLLVLTRSPEQEAALTALLDEQQDRSSRDFHRWLTPEQFGQQFGPADADIQAVTGWLTSQGFRVNSVAKGRTVIEFSGDVGLVRNAFHTQIHKYVTNGEEHWANASDPQIPAALAPMVGGIDSLNNFPRPPAHNVVGVFSRSKGTGEVKSASPDFTYPSPGTPPAGCGPPSTPCYALGPYDFATIYNVLPLWNAGIDGTGQTIAIVARSNINPQDVSDFRNLFGLPAKAPKVIVNGPPPVTPNVDDESEADLDVQWSGAVAKNATIDLVVSETTATTNGADLSAEYIVENNLAPIMSMSFQGCEFSLGTSGNLTFNQLWQQAAAQGITVFVATGDQGSADCDSPTSPTLNPPPAPAFFGLQVNGFASTPYNIAVGGTDFNDFNIWQEFWKANNNSTTEASAEGYIPETTWNSSCTNADFGSSPEANCNARTLSDFVVTSGGGGGASSCTMSDFNPSTKQGDLSSCSAPYAKPVFQAGPGVPDDGKRDIPDVSLFASPGFTASFYVICQSDQTNNSCNLNSSFTNFVGIGGTSAASPAFAGIMALVNQKVGASQGNANYVFYKLAAQSGASCPSSGAPGTSCIFYDVTTGTNAMPCLNPNLNSIPNFGCDVSNSADQFGILSGYSATAGYDLATGLGSVNATNLVNNWTSSTVVGGFGLSPNPASVNIAAAGQSGTSSITVTGTGGFAGTVSFACSVSPLPPNDPPTCFANPSSIALSATTTTATANLRISTTAGLSGGLQPEKGPNKLGYLGASMGLVLACFFMLGRPTPRKQWTASLGLVVLVLMGVALSSCASGSGGSSQINFGTPTGSYTVTVNASSGSTTQTTSVAVTVQ